MTTRQGSSMVVALFNDEDQAQQAVHALMQAGYDSDQISFAGHGTPRGLPAGIKSLFTGEAMSMGGAYDDLVARGYLNRMLEIFSKSTMLVVVW